MVPQLQRAPSVQGDNAQKDFGRDWGPDTDLSGTEVSKNTFKQGIELVRVATLRCGLVSGCWMLEAVMLSADFARAGMERMATVQRSHADPVAG